MEFQEVDITSDGGLKKQILSQGSGEQTPQKDQEVSVLYRGTLLDGKEFDSNQNRENPFTFTIGQGQVIKGWDQGVATMKKGEKAILTCAPDYAYGEAGSPPSIPKNATLKFEVELLDFKDKEKTKWDYTPEERLSQAEQFKTQANDLFKQKKYQDALQLYENALDYITEDAGEQQKQLKVALQGNLAAVYYLQSEFTKVIEKCSSVLQVDDKNVKALLRRGIAYGDIGEFDSANNDLNLAQEIDPSNAVIKKEIQNLKLKEKKYHQKQKNMFAGLFGQQYYKEEPAAVGDPSDANNPVVFMDIKIGDAEPERIEMELYKNVVPKTAENFRALCTGEKGTGKSGKPLHFKGSTFHRIIKGFMAQGGDFTQGNGTGGESIYGEKFQDENFKVKHTKRGQLSMANAGKDTNGSQFFITFKETPHLDGKHVIFGQVVKNTEFLDKLEAVQTGQNDKPEDDVRIVDCGQVQKEE